MQRTDVAIIGAGTAGTLAAAILGRAGYATALIDPATRFGPDFRCEKLEDAHVGALQKAGFLADVLPAARRYDTIWIARQGYLVEKRPRTEYGIDYPALVNTMRNMLAGTVSVIGDKVVGVEPDARETLLRLGDGGSLTARLVVVATGLNAGLLGTLGMERRMVSRCHSISIGFDVAPLARERFPFDALTYFGEHPDHKVAYFTLFPIGAGTRANLFVYREKGDPWFAELRADPAAALHACMPRLRKITGDFEVRGNLRVRPTDLVDTANYEKPGLVLIGDAFSTACPVSGTGASKALVDAERLCDVYAPKWLAGPDIPYSRIAEFYRDDEKVASDQHSRALSVFARQLALEPGLTWTAYRWLRYAASLGRDAVAGLQGRPHGVPDGREDGQAGSKRRA
ncbi:MAG: FAD-dependent monooxygenase [Rhizobiales bacterium]|nr:FAD-dependent monooxygenase [Hyphomicrobiales bacterium]